MVIFKVGENAEKQASKQSAGGRGGGGWILSYTINMENNLAGYGETKTKFITFDTVILLLGEKSEMCMNIYAQICSLQHYL